MTGGISNSSTSSDLYTDYSASHISTVAKGEAVTLTVTSNTFYSGYDVIYAFIDYNADGDFDDSYEINDDLNIAY